MPLSEILIPGEGIRYKQKVSRWARGKCFTESNINFESCRGYTSEDNQNIGVTNSAESTLEIWSGEKKSSVKFKQSAMNKKRSTQYNAFQKLKTVIPLQKHLRPIL